MVAAAGQRRETKIALQRDDLGLGRDARKPKPGGEEPLVHDAVAGQRRILRLVHDQRTEVAGVGHHPAQQGRVGDRVAPVREGAHAGVRKQPDLGHLAAGETLGERGRGMDVDRRGLAGGAHDEFGDGHVVDRPGGCPASSGSR